MKLPDFYGPGTYTNRALLRYGLVLETRLRRLIKMRDQMVYDPWVRLLQRSSVDRGWMALMRPPTNRARATPILETVPGIVMRYDYLMN